MPFKFCDPTGKQRHQIAVATTAHELKCELKSEPAILGIINTSAVASRSVYTSLLYPSTKI